MIRIHTNPDGTKTFILSSATIEGLKAQIEELFEKYEVKFDVVNTVANVFGAKNFGFLVKPEESTGFQIDEIKPLLEETFGAKYAFETKMTDLGDKPVFRIPQEMEPTFVRNFSYLTRVAIDAGLVRTDEVHVGFGNETDYQVVTIDENGLPIPLEVNVNAANYDVVDGDLTLLGYMPGDNERAIPGLFTMDGEMITDLSEIAPTATGLTAIDGGLLLSDYDGQQWIVTGETVTEIETTGDKMVGQTVKFFGKPIDVDGSPETTTGPLTVVMNRKGWSPAAFSLPADKPAATKTEA